MEGNNAIETRRKFVIGWNETMIAIWRDQIMALGVVDTGALFNSVHALPIEADGRFADITVTEMFLQYGLYQDSGVGKEKYRGNPGDIGPTKADGTPRHFRDRRPWFSGKYYSSVMKFKEFMAESLGQEFCGIITNALSNLDK